MISVSLSCHLCGVIWCGADLIRALHQHFKHPLFMTRAAEIGRFMLLVNKTYTSPDTPLSEGDRVSVVLRMSGI